jgi:hypothetical protein
MTYPQIDVANLAGLGRQERRQTAVHSRKRSLAAQVSDPSFRPASSAKQFASEAGIGVIQMDADVAIRIQLALG